MKKDKTPNQVLGHADEADGIEEYDNPLPDWWLGLLWFTVIWAVGYTLHYHLIADRSQVKTLAAEIAAAETRWPQPKADAPFTPTEQLAALGEPIYKTNCVACHGAELKGGIGPDLTDDTWIHGSSPESVLKTIRDGIPTKGMPTWGPILGPEKTRQVAAYVLHESAED